MALTLAMYRLRLKCKYDLVAAHVNHGLRGKESEADQAFVESFCRKLSLPLRCVRLVPPLNAGETWAREARYNALEDIAYESNCSVLVLAHHQDDQAETLLEHLLRGAGPEGLAGMRLYSKRGSLTIARPLLTVSRKQLRDVLAQEGATWREDSLNGDTRYLRNYLRLKVMPFIEQVAPGASRRIAQAAVLQGNEQEMLSVWTESKLDSMETGWRALPLHVLEKLPTPALCRLLRLWWNRQNPALPRLNAMQTDDFASLVQKKNGARSNLPGGWHGERGYLFLHILPPVAEQIEPVALQGNSMCFCLGHVTAVLTSFSDYTTHGNGKDMQILPASLLRACTLRTRREGDWLQPFGGGGRKKLQDILTDRKIDAAFRDRIPLLCRGNEVLLVAGVLAGNVPQYDETKKNLMLQWRGTMPWRMPD